MRFLSVDEARNLAKRFAANGQAELGPYAYVSGYPSLQVAFEGEKPGRFFWLAERVVESLEYFDWCMLWVTQTGVWGSAENVHLFQALRRSYGSHHDIDESPALRCLRHEKVDLVSFLHVGMLNGWDMLLLTSHDYGRAFVSHDGWVELVQPGGQSLDPIGTSFSEAKLKCRTLRSAS